jgi:prevent-host-death family protein
LLNAPPGVPRQTILAGLRKLRIIRIFRKEELQPMLTVSSAEFQRHFGTYQDKALAEPVAITRNGRERLIVMAADEYRRLMRRARQVLPVEALSDADLEAIAQTEMASRHQHLDRELK